MTKMIYLACPYTHESGSVRANRKGLADRYAAKLAIHEKGGAIFSPITHGTRLEPHLPPRIAKDHSFWMDQCYPLLRKADALYLLPLQGWRESKGVNMELKFAAEARIPIHIVQNVMFESLLEVIHPGDIAVPVEGVIWINGEPV